MTKHDLLPHDPGDDWECECGEWTDTKAEMEEHIADEKFNASPEGQARQRRLARRRAYIDELDPPLFVRHYLNGLVTLEEASERSGWPKDKIEQTWEDVKAHTKEELKADV